MPPRDQMRYLFQSARQISMNLPNFLTLIFSSKLRKYPYFHSFDPKSLFPTMPPRDQIGHLFRSAKQILQLDFSFRWICQNLRRGFFLLQNSENTYLSLNPKSPFSNYASKGSDIPPLPIHKADLATGYLKLFNFEFFLKTWKIPYSFSLWPQNHCFPTLSPRDQIRHLFRSAKQIFTLSFTLQITWANLSAFSKYIDIDLFFKTQKMPIFPVPRPKVIFSNYGSKGSSRPPLPIRKADLATGFLRYFSNFYLLVFEFVFICKADLATGFLRIASYTARQTEPIESLSIDEIHCGSAIEGQEIQI